LRNFIRWNPELEGKVIAMWLAGRSAGIIGETLGIGRGAVMGKLDRLGYLRIDRVGKTARLPRLSEPREPRDYVKREYRVRPNVPEPEPKNLTVLELTNRTCRWPHGDWDYRFCGHRVHPGSPYCEYHFHLSRK
jgi:hypothetical protein